MAASVSAAALAYVAAYLPTALQTKNLRVITDRVLDGGVFTDDFLRQVVAATRQAGPDLRCEQGSSEDFATLAVFAAGSTSAQAPPGERITLDEARRYVRSAIRCSPSKPFLWFLLFWVESRTDVAKAMPFLEMSYRLGRHEGWLAPARIKAAMPILGQAPRGLQEAVSSEYQRLVVEDIDTALGLLMMSDSVARMHMSEALSGVPAPIRAQFTQRLEEADIKVGPSN